MNILDQFEQIAYQRLSDYGKTKIHSVKTGRILGKYYYEICAYVNGCFVFGQEGSQGLAIDQCIKSLPDYEESAERVKLQSE